MTQSFSAKYWELMFHGLLAGSFGILLVTNSIEQAAVPFIVFVHTWGIIALATTVFTYSD